jgi:NAD+ synthase (glutamine-hydrolysing)
LKSFLRIAGAAVNQTPMDWPGNRANLLAAIAGARKQNVELLCFPELSLTGYGCEDLFLSDWLSERAGQEVSSIARHCRGLTVCIGLPVRIGGNTYNGVCVISDTHILGITLKQNLARDGVHYEPRWFEAWERGKTTELELAGTRVQAGDLVYPVKGLTFGFEICEDAWRKSRPAQSLCERGVDLILNPSASHFALGKSASREALVVESSVSFRCAYLYVNLLGNEAGRMIYDGDVLLANRGRLLMRAPRLSFSRFTLQHVDLDIRNDQDAKLLPDISPREEEFAQAEALALYDYLRKSRARGFVLSLSGGADSGCCAVLVAEMVRRSAAQLGWPSVYADLGLDPDKVQGKQQQAVGMLLHCVYQATKNSSEETLAAAQTMAHSLGARFTNWSVREEVDSYTGKIEKAIGRKLSWDTDDIALQNIQARARSPVVWMLANVTKAVLLTTSNRSEGAVGYATMDGDTSGSLAPIAGIDKPFILRFLRYAESRLGYHGLAKVNRLQPTAELRPAERAQTDEGDLMPYAVLADIEREALLHRKSPVQVYEALRNSHTDPALLKQHIRRFFRLWAANQWKRERLAPSFHVDDLNVDPRSWCRFPILSSGFDDELKLLDGL